MNKSLRSLVSELYLQVKKKTHDMIFGIDKNNNLWILHFGYQEA